VKRIIGFDIGSTNSEEARLTWEIRGYAAEIEKKKESFLWYAWSKGERSKSGGRKIRVGILGTRSHDLEAYSLHIHYVKSFPLNHVLIRQ
jgi:hypothetical protein